MALFSLPPSMRLHRDPRSAEMVARVGHDRVHLSAEEGRALLKFGTPTTFESAVAELPGARPTIEQLIAAELIVLVTPAAAPDDDGHRQLAARVDAVYRRRAQFIAPRPFTLVVAEALHPQLGSVSKPPVRLRDFDPRASDSVVYLCNSIDADALELNGKVIAARASAVFVQANERSVVIGPVVRPNSTGCLECLVHRRIANSLYKTATRIELTGELVWSAPSTPWPQWPAAIELGALASAQPREAGASPMTAIDLVDDLVDDSFLLAHPRCSRCCP